MIDALVNTIFANQFLVLLIVAVLLLGAAELGYRLGLRLHRSKDEPRKGVIGGTQGAVLGLLALLLGFTFAIAAGRYETRRTLVLSEANAIGTTYLRASLLPAEHIEPVQNLLRRYVDLRLEFYNAGDDAARQSAAEQAAATIQQELWNRARAAARESPTPITATFITSLNDTIDMDSARNAALHSHVPGAVWLLVLAVAALGCFVNSYGAGAVSARSNLTNILMPLLLCVVITLITDLDHPRGGMIGISQQPMLDLKKSFGPGS